MRRYVRLNTGTQARKPRRARKVADKINKMLLENPTKKDLGLRLWLIRLELITHLKSQGYGVDSLRPLSINDLQDLMLKCDEDQIERLCAEYNL